jgi:anti-sigma regulatory factor (Ser/Thr protein kinase)
MSELTLPAALKHLEELVGFDRQCAAAHGFPDRRIRQMELASEEALVNVMHYAYPEKQEGEVTVRCGTAAGGPFVIEIMDRGVPFQPGDVKAPDLTAGIAEREIGGLGVYLMRKMVDEVLYRREGDMNILTLFVYP